MRKVEPLARALDGKQAWMTGRAPGRGAVAGHARRSCTSTSAAASSRSTRSRRWTDDDIATYKRDHDLLEHPLVAQGYPSIGCWPCTRPVAPGEDPRSGRWAATGKTECGLHGWPQP